MIIKLHHSAVVVVIVLPSISLCQRNTLSSCRPHFFSSKVVSTQPRVNSSPFHICFLFLFFPIVPQPLRSAGHNVVETLHCCHSASFCVTCRHVTFNWQSHFCVRVINWILFLHSCCRNKQNRFFQPPLYQVFLPPRLLADWGKTLVHRHKHCCCSRSTGLPAPARWYWYYDYTGLPGFDCPVGFNDWIELRSINYH